MQEIDGPARQKDPRECGPEVLLRLFAPPPIEIRGQLLGDLLRPAYFQLADEAEPPEAGQQPEA